MQIRERDKKALAAAVAALAVFAIFRFGIFPVWDRWQDEHVNLPVRERTLAKYREAVETSALWKTKAEVQQGRLRDAEAGLLTSATPALGSAELQDWIKQLTAGQGIEILSSDFLPPRPLGSEYLQVPLGLRFDCRLDQLVNLLGQLSQGAKSLAVSRLSVQATGEKDKRVNVTMSVAGMMRAQGAPARPE
jgi:hypothetical protein